MKNLIKLVFFPLRIGLKLADVSLYLTIQRKDVRIARYTYTIVCYSQNGK